MVLFNRFLCVRVMRRTSSSVVFRGLQLDSGVAVAIKIADADSEKAEGIETEVLCLRDYLRPLCGGGIPEVLAVGQTSELDGTCTEVAVEDVLEDSSLSVMVTAPFGTPLPRVGSTSESWRSVCVSACALLRRIHDLGVLHGDMHRENIVLVRGAPHFIDFGRAECGNEAARRRCLDELGELIELLLAGMAQADTGALRRDMQCAYKEANRAPLR